jgi:hypothetical protein
MNAQTDPQVATLSTATKAKILIDLTDDAENTQVFYICFEHA